LLFWKAVWNDFFCWPIRQYSEFIPFTWFACPCRFGEERKKLYCQKVFFSCKINALTVFWGKMGRRKKGFQIQSAKLQSGEKMRCTALDRVVSDLAWDADFLVFYRNKRKKLWL
jgi:hypothetical protein